MSGDLQQARKRSYLFRGGWFQPISWMVAIVWLALVALPAGAQSYSTLYSFSGESDGLGPEVGVTMDRGGNLYGATVTGGYLGGNCQRQLGCGLVYKLTPHGSGWTLAPLYAFMGGSDGNMPLSRVVFGPDGALYGTTQFGGTGCQQDGGCGTIYRATPPATICRSVSCPWTETVIHRFDSSDGAVPVGDIIFDQSGNIYGTTSSGGTNNLGTVFQLNHSSGQWVLNTLLSFSYGNGGFPSSGVIFDQAGNLYGATGGGGNGYGVIYELSPSGSGWTDTTLYVFQGSADDGGDASGGLIFDAAGNLYGTTIAGGSDGQGTVFELSPSNGSWSINVLHSFTELGGGPLLASLTFDPAGNLYGVTTTGGLNEGGNVFELTPSNGGWTYSDLYDFPEGHGSPYGTLLWNNGTLYGTTQRGGTDNLGTVFEVTP